MGYRFNGKAWKNISFEKLDLGKEYLMNYMYLNIENAIRVKLIKTTRKGYNFLNIKTNKCILKNHMYVNKIGLISLGAGIRISKCEIGVDENKLINIF